MSSGTNSSATGSTSHPEKVKPWGLPLVQGQIPMKKQVFARTFTPTVRQ